MTSSEREYLEKLERRMQALERSRASRFTRPLLLVIPLAAVAVLAASAPSTFFSALESRLFALESLIHLGPDSSLVVKAPFKVVGGDGKILLNVATNSFAGLVNVTRVPNHPGGTVTINGLGGKTLVTLGVNAEGNGRASTLDAQGKVAAMMGENGLAVFDAQEKQIAGVTRGQGQGRVGILHNGKWVAELIADPAGNGVIKSYGPGGNTPVVTLGADPQRGNAGALTLMSPAGTVVAAMAGTTGGNAGTISVMNSAGKPVAGLTAASASGGAVVVANAGGVGLAQMSITSDGRGLVQIFGQNQNPLAVLTQALDRVGGLVQIYNSGNSVANLTVGSQGAGYLQLSDPSGNPTVEAGTLSDGNGQVRAGPRYQCLPVTLSGPISFVPNCIMGSKK
jgi:hypothetical protein